MIDTPIFFFHIEAMHNLLILPVFRAFSVWQCGILSMIDAPFFHFIELYRNEATFLAFAPFSEHFQYDSVEYYR